LISVNVFLIVAPWLRIAWTAELVVAAAVPSRNTTMYSPAITLEVGFVALAVLALDVAFSSETASSTGSLLTGAWQPMSAMAPAAHRPLRNFVTVLRCIRISCWG
jgi:hypothetical protein